MTFLARVAQIFSPHPLESCRFDESMAGLVDEFRNTRASELAALIESRGERGAQLAACQIEVNQWRLYARRLEKACLEHGLELPPAPDEG